MSGSTTSRARASFIPPVNLREGGREGGKERERRTHSHPAEGDREGGREGRKDLQGAEVGGTDTENLVPVDRPTFHHKSYVGKGLVVDKATEVGKEGWLGDLTRKQSGTEFKGPEIIEAV